MRIPRPYRPWIPRWGTPDPYRYEPRFNAGRHPLIGGQVLGALLILWIVFMAGIQIGIHHGRTLERSEAAALEGRQ